MDFPSRRRVTFPSTFIPQIIICVILNLFAWYCVSASYCFKYSRVYTSSGTLLVSCRTREKGGVCLQTDLAQIPQHLSSPAPNSQYCSEWSSSELPATPPSPAQFQLQDSGCTCLLSSAQTRSGASWDTEQTNRFILHFPQQPSTVPGTQLLSWKSSWAEIPHNTRQAPSLTQQSSCNHRGLRGLSSAQVHGLLLWEKESQTEAQTLHQGAGTGSFWWHQTFNIYPEKPGTGFVWHAK